MSTKDYDSAAIKGLVAAMAKKQNQSSAVRRQGETEFNELMEIYDYGDVKGRITEVLTDAQKGKAGGLKVSDFESEQIALLTTQEIEAEQRGAALANSFLQEACRQYYWPQWHQHDVKADGRIVENAIRTELDELYAMTRTQRDLIISNRGYWTQKEWEDNRQSMAANGVPFAKGSLEEGSKWKMKTMGNRPPYQYLNA